MLEKEKTDWLITLCRNMHYIEAVLVLDFHVRTIVDESLTNISVASEGSVMNCGKLVFSRLKVDPLCDFLLAHLFLGPHDDGIKALFLVFEYSHM